MSSAAETVGRGLRTDLQFSHVPATGDLDKKNVGRAVGGTGGSRFKAKQEVKNQWV